MTSENENDHWKQCIKYPLFGKVYRPFSLTDLGTLVNRRGWKPHLIRPNTQWCNVSNRAIYKNTISIRERGARCNIPLGKEIYKWNRNRGIILGLKRESSNEENSYLWLAVDRRTMTEHRHGVNTSRRHRKPLPIRSEAILPMYDICQQMLRNYWLGNTKGN